MSEDTTPQPDALPRDGRDLIAAGREEARAWKQRRAELNIAAPAPLPEKIGPYKVIRRIGAGGMGVVYEAEQAEPSRRVAVKLIRGPVGADTYHLRLFQREIQILGRLRHSAIAQIYDAGHTEDGQQYFAMELIDGRPLVEFCELADLSLRDRLALFAEVCNAVQYAHQRGVIHRDLKPANILVDKDGKPHVLDFGLARVVDPEVDVTRSLLAGRAFIGTLPYMSPEQTQADPADLDIRTDVYSLGVILYEMLTGTYPYRVAGQIAEVLRNIAEAEPKKPSTVRRQINDEVETIVLKTLAKERERRYQSAEALARDIGHYLNGEPIDAKRDSTWYVIRKSLRRYRVAAGGAAAFVLLLAVSTILLSIMYQNQSRAREKADQARIAEEGQRKLADQRYEEIIRLADLKRLADAKAAADNLWPAHPEKIEAMQTWLEAQAAPLRDNLPKHEATLASLRNQALEYDPGQQKRDRETHPKAAELAEQRQHLTELQKELDDVRAEQSEDAEKNAKKIEELEESISDCESAIAELEEAVQERRSWKLPDGETQWQHDILAGLVEDLKTFVDADPKKGTVAGIEERLHFARSIEEKSTTGLQAATKWAEAIADIAQLEVYGGLQLTPQLGLLPLRRDSHSGLWEFRHIQTGTKPEPSLDSEAVNTWILTGDTGLIFVLVPGGTFWMGAQNDDPEGHNYDPQAETDQSPVHEVTLTPFFISKYEMTQSQWRRFTGRSPSRYGPSFSWKGDPPAEAPIHQNQPWNPVEQVAWTDCRDVLHRLRLVLPTEAQWEYAARAGTDSVWWTGSEKESIGVKGAGNLADGLTQSRGGPIGWGYEDWLEDGWVVHAPVGSFSANGFGLHDTIGNVWEWCREGRGGYDDADAQPGDGRRKAAGPRYRVLRGGSYGTTASFARSAYRNEDMPEFFDAALGVRPARAVKTDRATLPRQVGIHREQWAASERGPTDLSGHPPHPSPRYCEAVPMISPSILIARCRIIDVAPRLRFIASATSASGRSSRSYILMTLR